jgi:hypothetical protein
VAQATATSFQNLFEAEAGWTQLLQGVITSVCDGLGVEPDANTKGMRQGTHLFARWWRWVASSARRYETGCIMA